MSELKHCTTLQVDSGIFRVILPPNLTSLHLEREACGYWVHHRSLEGLKDLTIFTEGDDITKLAEYYPGLEQLHLNCDEMFFDDVTKVNVANFRSLKLLQVSCKGRLHEQTKF